MASRYSCSPIQSLGVVRRSYDRYYRLSDVVRKIRTSHLWLPAQSQYIYVAKVIAANFLRCLNRLNFRQGQCFLDIQLFKWLAVKFFATIAWWSFRLIRAVNLMVETFVAVNNDNYATCRASIICECDTIVRIAWIPLDLHAALNSNEFKWRIGTRFNVVRDVRRANCNTVLRDSLRIEIYWRTC